MPPYGSLSNTTFLSRHHVVWNRCSDVVSSVCLLVFMETWTSRSSSKYIIFTLRFVGVIMMPTNLIYSRVKIRNGKWCWKIASVHRQGGEGEGLKNPGWEICLKNLHKDKIETYGEVKCKRHIMSEKERTCGIYFIFSLWKRGWRRE